MRYALGVEGGTVVGSRGRRRANVYVADGRVAEITTELRPAAERVDAGGLLVLPGMIDAHVHFMDPGDPEREDFPTGTAAAAAAGVTTVIEHTHGHPVRSAAEFEAKREHLRSRARVDYGLAAHAWPDRLDEVEGVWRAGAAFVKAFTCTTHGVPGFEAGPLHELFERIAAADAVCMVHCEDESLTGAAERALRGARRTDGGIVPDWRNRDAELTALATAALLARSTGARMVAAHVSHAEALDVIARERVLGARITVESCPQYLELLEGEVLEHGPFRKFTPPARARSRRELDVMWDALAHRRIDYVSTDHAPSTREQKNAGSIWEVHFGLPGIDTTLPVLLNACAAGRISYERVAEAYAEVPAAVYGFAPAKGRIAPGADADLVLVDPARRWTVRDEDIHSRAAWSPYAGRELVGRAVRTYVRGQLVAADGEALAAPGAGRFVAGAGA